MFARIIEDHPFFSECLLCFYPQHFSTKHPFICWDPDEVTKCFKTKYDNK